MAVILVTHSMGDVQEFCNLAILLDRGHVIYAGDTQSATLRYYALQQAYTSPVQKLHLSEYPELQTDLNRTNDHPWPHLQNYFIEIGRSQQIQYATGFSLLRYCLTDDSDHPTSTFIQGTRMRLYSEWMVENKIEIPATAIIIWNDRRQPIYAKNTLQCDMLLHENFMFPFRVFSFHEIVLDMMCAEYTISHTLISAGYDFYKNRHVADFLDWEANVPRLVVAEKLTCINVVLPAVRYPSRVDNFGFANMASRCELHIRNAHER